MTAPDGITCVCGQAATTEHNIKKGRITFGRVYTCNQHKATMEGALLEVSAVEFEIVDKVH